MMDDLIRRSDALKELWYPFDFTRTEIDINIKHIPAVDAVEVRHGYWLSTLDGKVCSDCGSIERVCRRFCPQCGCDMRTGI